MAGPELSVVCKSCGSEVSPYVTECPYCGTRLRKRAPKLERVGDEVRVREGRADRRRRKAAERRGRLADRVAATQDLALRPLATIAVLLASAAMMVIEAASNLTVSDLGAIVGPVGDEFWRYFAAPFVYDNVGYLFACGLAIAIFLPPIERRVGSVAALLLVLGCGALGMLAAAGLDSALGDGILVAAGGNGIALGVVCAWLVIRDAERRADPTDEYDRIAVAVVLAVLFLLPAVVDYASVWAGLMRGAGRAPDAGSPPRWADGEQVHAADRRATRLHGRPRRPPGRGPAPAFRTETAAMGDISVMQIAPEQGAFLTLLAKLTGAREAIELGTFTGYSAICIARGLAPGGRLLACELSEEYAGIAAANLEAAGVADRVEIRIGPALETSGDARARALRLRLHRRRQGGLPRVLRAGPRADRARAA